MRKAILILVALGLLGGGLYLAAAQLFWSDMIAGKAMLAAGLMIGVGGWLLWEDALAPVLGRAEKT